MTITVTELENFFRQEMENEEEAQDINEVHVVINHVLKLNSTNYRCLVTPERELVIICFDDGKVNLKNTLVRSLEDETVLKAYGIEKIDLISRDEGTRYVVDSVREEGESELEEVLSHRSVFSYTSIDVSKELEYLPTYAMLFQEITTIRNLSLVTISEIGSKLSGDSPTIEGYTATIRDRSILLNTIEVFTLDAKECIGIENFIEELVNLKEYFYPKDSEENNIDYSESESIDNEKEILTTLKYILESPTFPFQERFLLCDHIKVHIKFYLLLCVAFEAFSGLRKSERTLEMRKNKKRYIEAINKILTDETVKIHSKHIISYIMSENPFFSEDNITETDIKLLRELKLILENRPENHSHRVARFMTEMFGESINVRNRLLRLVGLKGIGHDTKV